MHDAWWDTLTHIRDTAPPEAIVNTWWDYGHWVKYVAERPVSNDGSSLLTHVPHWLGKALVVSSARASVGVLRMLNCGSDATPLPEGRQGAYGKLRGTDHDPVTAYTIVADLVTLDKADAESYLAQRGFAAAERASILRSTHCVPPEAYLILSSGLLPKRRSWMSLGLWDPHRVHLARRSQVLSQEEAVAELVQLSDTVSKKPPSCIRKPGHARPQGSWSASLHQPRDSSYRNGSRVAPPAIPQKWSARCRWA